MKLKFLVAVLVFWVFNSVNALDLLLAPQCDGNPKNKSQSALDAGKIIGDVYTENSI